MPHAKKLSEAEISSALDSLPDWELREGKLYRELKFRDFVAAWGFLTQVAILAEKSNHHPEWFNVWATVRIWLETHDVGGLSQLDFELAAQIDALL